MSRVTVLIAIAVAAAAVLTPADAAASARGCEQRSDAARSAPVVGRSLMVAAAHPEAAAAGWDGAAVGG